MTERGWVGLGGRLCGCPCCFQPQLVVFEVGDGVCGAPDLSEGKGVVRASVVPTQLPHDALELVPHRVAVSH